MSGLDIPQFIGGQHAPPRSGEYLDNIEPATGRAYSRLAAGTDEDVACAVDAAARAFPAWAAAPADHRSALLLRIADGIAARLEEFARAESIDSGKPVEVARAVDIPRAVRNFRFFATAILHDSSQAHITDTTAINYTLRRPRGVCGLISPWNLPLYLLSWKVAPALATGNTAVAKPSELTPMTAHLLSTVCVDAGLPAGVLNIVHGLGNAAGAAITRHPDVQTISFTGGTKTGAMIAEAGAASFKKLALEMGGKNPTVVFADASFDETMRGALRSAFSNQGEICLCGSRIFVERAMYDRFVAEFVRRAKQLRVGDPLEDGTDQGAVISHAHRAKILSYIALAREEGGTILCGGGPASAPNDRCAQGFFVDPTVITDLSVDCRVNQEEIFGPVVTITPFDTEDEAVSFANATPYGLAASLWTANLRRAHRVADAIACGTIWVNCWMLRDLRVPFGGMKQSGLGREGGDEALRFFTEPKNVCVFTGS
jgi:aminomuconate-semialdehyde/2-hydroxymuconate-6-semialdehyde dehydrogenase